LAVRTQPGAWHRVASRSHLQLAGTEVVHSRVPGPVIGPGARVRPCSDLASQGEMDVICLEVEQDGKIERGYTVKRMVVLRPEDAPPMDRSRRLVIAGAGACVALAGIVAIFG
jgi:hypothetical protein